MTITAKVTIIKEDNGKIEMLEENREIQPTSITYKTEKGLFESKYKFGFVVKTTEKLKTEEKCEE